MKRKLLFLLAGACGLAQIIVLLGNSSGPSNATSGSPLNGGFSCVNCHSGNPLNDANGSIALTGVSNYVPGQSYSFTLAVNRNPSPVQYGFQAVALNGSNQQAGSFFTNDNGTKIITASGVSHIEHNTPRVSGVWTIGWTAPSTNMGPVTIYMAGNAANGSGTSGDFIYTDSYQLTALQPITANSSATGVQCFGDCNGSAELSNISGGLPPYTVSWDDPNNTVDSVVTGLCGGPVNATITDADGNMQVIPLVITEPDSIDINLAPIGATCGLSDGAVNTVVTGGTAPYNFLWSDGSTTANLTGLAAGTYSVTVSDALGCPKEASVVVDTTSSGLGAAIMTNPANCGDSNGTAFIAFFAGTGPFSVVWSNGDVGLQADSLAPGAVSAFVTDAVGCMDSFDDSISLLGVPTLSLTGDTLLCFGDSNGTASVSAVGNSTYSYAWSHDSTLSNATATGLMVGVYSVSVTDSAGCVTVDSVEVFENDEIVLASATVVDFQFPGSIDVTVSGGTPPYTYMWDGPAGFTGQDTNFFEVTIPGDYSLTVTDSNGCEKSLGILGVYPQSVASFNNRPNWKIFPNPAAGHFMLRNLEERSDIRLTSLDGRLVKQMPNTAPQPGDITIDISDIPSGTYFLTVEGKTSRGVRKVVIR